MIMTTTPSIEGRAISAYLGIVSGEAIVGASFFQDMVASMRDMAGGRSEAWETVMEETRRVALAELERHAAACKADAVVGIQFSHSAMPSSVSMLMVAVSGTAVKLA